MSNLKNITKETFAAEVVASEKPVVVDFWAEWCGPCRRLGPILEELSDEFKDTVEFVKVDVDQEPELAGLYRVTSIPAVFVLKKGETLHNFVGVKPKEIIKSEISAVL